MEILIVDDNAIALELLNYTLTSHGYHVISARDGAEAEEILHQRDCQIVITDWVMPVMSGVELCMYLRGAGLWALWPQTLALAGFAVGLITLSALRFKKRIA